MRTLREHDKVICYEKTPTSDHCERSFFSAPGLTALRHGPLLRGLSLRTVCSREFFKESASLGRTGRLDRSGSAGGIPGDG